MSEERFAIKALFLLSKGNVVSRPTNECDLNNVAFRWKSISYIVDKSFRCIRLDAGFDL